MLKYLNSGCDHVATFRRNRCQSQDLSQIDISLSYIRGAYDNPALPGVVGWIHHATKVSSNRVQNFYNDHNLLGRRFLAGERLY